MTKPFLSFISKGATGTQVNQAGKNRDAIMHTIDTLLYYNLHNRDNSIYIFKKSLLYEYFYTFDLLQDFWILIGY